MPRVKNQRVIAALAALALAACATPAAKAPSEPALDPVQRDVKRIVEALYSGDVNTVVHYTHPVIVEANGGEEAARRKLQQFVDDTLAKAEMKLESIRFPRPPEYLESEGRRFAVVPTLSLYSLKGGQHVESQSYYVGILDVGASEWRYAEGARVTPQNLQRLFPGFPADYKFPDTYRKKL